MSFARKCALNNTKIELLEQKLMEMSQNYQFNQKHLNEAKGVFQLRTTLKTLDVDESHILELIKKANYELFKKTIWKNRM